MATNLIFARSRSNWKQVEFIHTPRGRQDSKRPLCQKIRIIVEQSERDIVLSFDQYDPNWESIKQLLLDELDFNSNWEVVKMRDRYIFMKTKPIERAILTTIKSSRPLSTRS